LAAVVKKAGQEVVCKVADFVLYDIAYALIEEGLLYIPGFDLIDLIALGIAALALQVRQWAHCRE
jgi:hypothetical protein